MTKAELIERIARCRDLPPDMTKKGIGQILDLAFDELAAYFSRARVTRKGAPRFTFPGFGTFTKKRRSARRGVNPRTLAPIVIEACTTLDFKPGKALQEALNPQRVASTELADAADGREDRGAASIAVKPAKAAAKRKPKPAARPVAKPAAKPARELSVKGVDGRRRLTPRDDVELVALRARANGNELPEPPLQRVRPRRRDAQDALPAAAAAGERDVASRRRD